MTSKLLVKLPTVAFPEGRRQSTADLPIGLPERNDGTRNQQTRKQSATSPTERVIQLEQNLKFLQEQHQVTLTALHQEVEILRQKNRDLQFQLVFSKGSGCVPSSPSSPEDNGPGFAKSKGSPNCPVNVTPLHVELLEKELQDTKLSLHQAKTQNQHLNKVIEEQKKQLTASRGKGKKALPVAEVELRSTNDKYDTAEGDDEEAGHEEEPEKAEAAEEDDDEGDSVACLKTAEAKAKRSHKKDLDQRQEVATLRTDLSNNGVTSAVTCTTAVNTITNAAVNVATTPPVAPSSPSNSSTLVSISGTALGSVNASATVSPVASVSTTRSDIVTVTSNISDLELESEQVVFAKDPWRNRSTINDSPESGSSHKFPPLQSQSYCHRRSLRSGRQNRREKQEHRPEVNDSVATLPQLQSSSTKTEDTTVDQPFYRSRGYCNHYRERDERSRKHIRGSGHPRDRRESDQQHYRHQHHYQQQQQRQQQQQQQQQQLQYHHQQQNHHHQQHYQPHQKKQQQQQMQKQHYRSQHGQYRRQYKVRNGTDHLGLGGADTDDTTGEGLRDNSAAE